MNVDEDLTIEAARLKLRYYNILSLADCYLIVLAKRSKAAIVTTDHNVKNVNETLTHIIIIIMSFKSVSKSL